MMRLLSEAATHLDLRDFPDVAWAAPRCRFPCSSGDGGTLIHLNWKNGASVDVRISIGHRTGQFGAMKWKVIRLELASSWQFPRGSAGRSYLVRVPLTDEGTIDAAALEAQPARATVRRYWPNQADMVGQLIHTATGYAIQYDLNGLAQPGGQGANGHGEPRLVRFSGDAIKLGDEIFLTEPDGNEARYRIANLQ